MANIIEPDEILMHFLRSKLDDVVTSDHSSRTSNDSDTFAGDGAETDFTLTNNPVCITSVTVDGTEVYPFTHFNIDLDNKQVKFLTAPADSAVIVVNYKKGTNWIYADKSRDTLSRSSYPRIEIMMLPVTGERTSVAGDETLDNVNFTITVVTQKELEHTIDGESKYGQDAVNYIGRKVKYALTKEWRLYLSGKLFNPEILGSGPVPFNPLLSNFQKVIDVKYSGFNLGEE